MAFETHINVRFGETDAMGHVNNVSYYIYFEQARVEFLKNIGFTIGKSSNDLNFVVVHTSCDYKNQAYFDQHLVIKTYVSSIGNKSFTLNHDVLDFARGTLIAAGTSVAVIFDVDAQGAIMIPDFLKDALQLELANVKETNLSSCK